MMLDEAVVEIRSKAKRHPIPGEHGNLWDTSLAQIVARDSIDGKYADILSGLISEFLDGLDDGAVIDLWGQTETGADDDPEELVVDSIRFAILDELLDEVTKAAWEEAK